MTVIVAGFERTEAQIMEQVLISTFTLQYLDNARREIAVKNIEKYRENIYNVIEIFSGAIESDILSLMGR